MQKSNPNCGIAREREKKNRERELSCEKLQPKAQVSNPGLLTEQRIEQIPKESQPAADQPNPHQRQRGRQATARAGRRRAISAPETASSTKLSRIPVANQVFLGSWMVDIRQEGRSQRSAPQRRHSPHLRRCSRSTPRKLSGWDRGGDKMHCPPGESALTKHLVA